MFGQRQHIDDMIEMSMSQQDMRCPVQCGVMLVFGQNRVAG